MRQLTLTTRKLILGAGLFVFIYIVFWFLFSYSWLTLTAPSGEKSFVTIRDKDGEKVQTLEEFSGSKTIILRRDTYKIEAARSDELSVYKKSMRFLWSNRLDLELAPQKASRFLGTSPLPCAKEKGDEVLFSSCSPYEEFNIIKSGTRGYLIQEDAITEHEHSQNDTVTGTLLNYKDGYLNARTKEGRLIVSSRETNNDKSLAIEDFEGEVNSSTFSVSTDSENFALYSAASNEILSFKNITDNNPLKISLPDDRGASYFVNRIFASNNYVYFLSSIDYETEDHSHLDDGEGLEEAHEDPPGKTKQKIFIYNNSTGGLEGEHDLSRDWQVQNIVTGPDDQALLVVSVFKKSIYGQTYLINGYSRPSEIETIAKRPQQFCWKDSDSFYYSDAVSSGIYLFSLSKQASFLVYTHPYGTIANLICESGGVTFVSNPQKGVNPNDNYFFKLSDKDFGGGVRLESTLPLILSTGSGRDNLVRVQLGVGHVNIFALPPPESPYRSKEKLKDFVIKELQDRSVDTKDLKFKFHSGPAG